MLVTVIIPTYKPGEYLFECLDSLILQTLDSKVFEILIILNGCAQPYLNRIEQYICLHPNNYITLYQTDMQGVSNARNMGLDLARGEYITFIDDDDIVSPLYLEELYMVSSPTCVGCSNSWSFVSEREEKQVNFISLSYQKCKKQSFSTFRYRSFLSPPWCKLIHRDIIGKTRFSRKLKKGEDGLFCFAISIRIKDMKLAHENAVYYQRLRDGSAMRKKNSFVSELFEAISQEVVLSCIWIKNPFAYNPLYTLSRFGGILWNFFKYIK